MKHLNKISSGFRLSLSLSLSLLCSFGIAQQNGGFEAWSPSGSPPPFNWLFPTHWTTNNATTEFASSGVKRSTDKHSGTYAAELRSLNIFGTLRRSELVLGTSKLDYANYAVVAHSGGESLDMIPSGISFYYKLNSDGADDAVATVLIKRPDGEGMHDTVVHITQPLTAVDVYTEVTIEIPDVEIDIETDSLVIFFASNDDNEEGENFLYVDDVTVDFSSSVANVALDHLEIVPNPAHIGENLSIGRELRFIRAWILDANGQVVAQQNSNGEIQTQHLHSGLYFLMTEDGKTGRVVLYE